MNKILASSLLLLILNTWLFCDVDAQSNDDSNTINTEPNNDLQRVTDFLLRYGYIPKKDLSSTSLKSSDNLEEAIKRMQSFGGIPPTGVIDEATVQLMHRPRCGNRDEDISTLRNQNRRFKRYALQGNKWSRTNLTWSIKHWPTSASINSSNLRAELSRALKIWSDVSKLTFTETRRSDADIVISFLSGKHGDDYPFDGRGNILAHAFFPMPGTNIGGDAHFDADEKWVENSRLPGKQVNDPTSKEGVSLFAVAAHEFGHSLGLSHSSVAGSLMYPYYQSMKENFDLPYDDTIGIQLLYGPNENKPVNPNVPTPPTNPDTPKTTSTPAVPPVRPTRPKKPEKSNDSIPFTCDTDFDAISSIRGEVFAFKGRYFWRLNDVKKLETPEAVDIKRFWLNFPIDLKRIDAVYEKPNAKHIVFFSGRNYWLFDGNSPLQGYPRPLTHLGISEDVDSIDAAMVWSHNQRVYLFAGEQYWRMDAAGDRIEPDYPRHMSVWRGVPYHLSAAFQWHRNGVNYFFKGTKFYKLDNRKMKVTSDSPKVVSDYWFESFCDPSKAGKEKYTDDVDPKVGSSHHLPTNCYLIITSLCVILFYKITL